MLVYSFILLVIRFQSSICGLRQCDSEVRKYIRRSRQHTKSNDIVKPPPCLTTAKSTYKPDEKTFSIEQRTKKTPQTGEIQRRSLKITSINSLSCIYHTKLSSYKEIPRKTHVKLHSKTHNWRDNQIYYELSENYDKLFHVKQFTSWS